MLPPAKELTVFQADIFLSAIIHDASYVFIAVVVEGLSGDGDFFRPVGQFCGDIHILIEETRRKCQIFPEGFFGKSAPDEVGNFIS